MMDYPIEMAVPNVEVPDAMDSDAMDFELIVALEGDNDEENSNIDSPGPKHNLIDGNRPAYNPDKALRLDSMFPSFSLCDAAITHKIVLEYTDPSEYYSAGYGIDLREWSSIESYILYAISTAMQLCGGTICPMNWNESAMYSNIHKACWEKIKEQFDKALYKYVCIRHGEEKAREFNLQNRGRTWEELAEHRCVLEKMSWCQENAFFFHNVNYLWFNKYNKGFALFDAGVFEKQFRDNYELLGMDEYVDVLDAFQLYNDLKDVMPMSKNEELILVGAVFDRIWSYENRGGSVITSNEESNLRKRSWLSIKKQYDLAWKNAVKNFPSHFSFEGVADRSAEDLRIQYNLMRIRSFCKFRTEKENIHSLLLEWCDLNKSKCVISDKESLALQPDDRYDDALASQPEDSYDDVLVDSLFKTISLGSNVMIKNKNVLKPHGPKTTVLDPFDMGTLFDGLETVEETVLFQQYPPSDVRYYEPNDYYYEIKADFKPWTEIENMFVKAIAGTMYYTCGTKMIAKGVGDSLRDWLSYSIYVDVWKRVKEAFDYAIRKYVTNSKERIFIYARSWEELAHHFIVITNIDWRRENRFYIYDMIHKWNNEYNVGYCLFNPNQFLDQFEKNKTLLETQMQDVPDVKTTLRENIKNITVFSQNEETILYGAMEDRNYAYVNRGGSALTSNGSSDLGRHSWRCIKKQYDLAWDNAIKKFPLRFRKSEYVDRSPDELRIHYKIMFYRPISQIDDNQRYIHDLRNAWHTDLNKDGELISKKESLASQPDDRYHGYDPPNPANIEGLPERPGNFDQMVSQWPKSMKRDRIDRLSHESNFSPVNVDAGVKRINKESPTYGFNPSKKRRGNGKSSGDRLEPGPSNRPLGNEWTRPEDIILYGVMLLRSIYANSCSSDQSLDREAIKEAFDTARRRYNARDLTPKVPHVERSIETLEKRIVDLAQEYAPTDSHYENDLRSMWIEWNQDSPLLKEGFFNKFITKTNEVEEVHEVDVADAHGIEEVDVADAHEVDEIDVADAHEVEEDDYFETNKEIDDILLFGVLTELLLCTGVMYQYSSSEKRPKSREKTWRLVNCVFNRMRIKFYTEELDGQSRILERNWEALERYYTEHMLERLSERPFLLYEMHKHWIIINKDHKLLRPIDFSTYAEEADLPDRIPVYSYPTAEDISKVEQVSNKIKHPYTPEEITILVGVVMDRFLSTGLFSSAQRDGHALNGGKDCWDKVKSQFDLVCQMAIEKEKFQIPSYEERTPSGLFYKYKKLRPAVNGLYDRWRQLNENDSLLSRANSLCNH